MKIQLNGEEREIREGLSLAQLVASLVPEGSRYAVEVNEELVPRSQHQSYLLKEQDRVEMVQAIGGG